MIKVGVLGYRGRMGSAVCEAVQADPDLELAARVEAEDSLDALLEAEVDAAVDFTTPQSVLRNVEWLLENGIHAVVGTTGLDDGNLADIRSWAEASEANCFVAPNFAVGAVLMMEFARQAAPHFRAAEIVERHHDRKLDAPSGTALRTAALMNEARSDAWTREVASEETTRGALGADVDDVHVHSLRVPGSVAHQEVILGGAGETLTIRHDSLDRSSFMPGVLLAVKEVGRLDGLTVGLERLLGL